MNWAALGEFVHAVLVTQTDVFHRLLGTTNITVAQFFRALVPAVAPRPQQNNGEDEKRMA